MSKHPIVHIEFSAKDHEVAAQFYNDVFGWEIQHMSEINYSTFMYDKNSAAVSIPPQSKTQLGP